MNIFKKAMALTLTCAVGVSLIGCGKASENTIFSVDDLAGKVIGVQLGTTGDLYATDEYESTGSTIERYNKGADAIQSLKQGKIDCVIIDEQPAKFFVDKNDDLTILEEEFTTEDYAMCLAKENTELTEEINGALAELKNNGTLEAIINNYIGDHKGETPYLKDESADRSKGELIMATNAAFEPYEYYSENKIVGIDADLAQAICDLIGYELVIEDMEFDSIINAVQSGKAHIGVAGMTVNEERLKNVNFTDTYTTSTQVIITRK